MKRWTTLALGAVGILGSRGVAEAATSVGPGEVGGQTWTLANSPYVVQGDVSVMTGTTLKIEPGVQVLFAAQDKGATGLDTKTVELTVAGTLVADGTEKQPISFGPEAVGTAKGSWYGIVVGANATASLSFDTMAGAFAAVRTNSPNLTLHDVKITNATAGVMVTGAPSPTLRRLSTTGCTTGVAFVGSGGGTIAESIFDTSTSAAIHAQVTGDAAIKIQNTVITGGNNGILLKQLGVGNTLGVDITSTSLSNGNTRGIWVENNPGSTTTVTMSSSILTSFGNVGIELEAAGNTTDTFSIDFSDVFGNKLNYVGVTAGQNCISLDPKFAANPPLALQETSPCKDKGTGINAPSFDILGHARPFGAGYDMGAYEYGSTAPADPPDAGVDAGLDAGGGDDAGPVADAGTPPSPGPDAASGSSSSSSAGGASAAPSDSGINTGTPTVPPPAPSEDDCSVHAIGASGAGGLWLLGAAVTLMARRRRRR